jgi:hypothetical protein
MKKLIAGFTGGLLTASLVAAPSLLAGDNGHQSGRYNGAATTTSNGHYANGNGVHAVGNGYYVNVQGQRVAWPSGGVLVAEPGGMFVSQNGRIYYVHDDPRYDLSGAGKTLILVDDGGTYKVESGNIPAALASGGGAPKEVVTVPAEYRQHWLAVAAGDRPVRNMTSVPVTSQGPAVTFMPVYFSRDAGATNGNGRAAYTNGAKAKRTNGTYKTASATKRTAVRKTNGYRKTNGTKKSTASVASTTRNGYRNGSRTGYQNGYRRNGAVYTADTSDRTRVGATYAAMPEERTRNLYQVGSSWYQREGDTWSRSDSWRGPFVTVSKGSVPREVKMAAKKPFRD